ncbi:protein-glutamine glutaminase family protein (plasmid) [Embleya sp. NBC_00888]|uniref:protein-glutamine glutaminase family protein n=1 Tax=Embleya sp. NBC_00888 TaxID=2975960 RepID=UPI002F911D7D|nr:protein-glutamine glutaminase family protein [Embleya sp. NBC_00888]
MKRDRDLKKPSSQGVKPIERGPDDDTKRPKLTRPAPDTEPAGNIPVIVPEQAIVPGDGPGTAAADTPPHLGAAVPATVPAPETRQTDAMPETQPAPQPYRFQRAPGFLAAEKAEEAEEERRRLKAEAEAAAAAKPRGPGAVAERKVPNVLGSRAGVGEESDEERGPARFEELSRTAIALLPLDRITAAIEKRHDDFAGLTPDMGALTFRQSALGLCANLSLARSVGCVARVRSWLATQADLVPELIVLCDQHVAALALPAEPPPSVAELIAVWTQLTDALIVPEGKSRDGCEFLAHAVCVWIESTQPHWARLHLSKRWVVAPNGTMHPPYNWNHHVAPQLVCTEGTFVIDLLLGPTTPMAADAWAVAAKGKRPPVDVFEQTAPWEFLGAPASTTTDLDPEMLSPFGDTILSNIAACRRA